MIIVIHSWWIRTTVLMNTGEPRFEIICERMKEMRDRISRKSGKSFAFNGVMPVVEFEYRYVVVRPKRHPCFCIRGQRMNTSLRILNARIYTIIHTWSFWNRWLIFWRVTFACVRFPRIFCGSFAVWPLLGHLLTTITHHKAGRITSTTSSPVRKAFFDSHEDLR